MKKNITFAILGLLLLLPANSFAQSPTESRIPSDETQGKINEKVDELKDKIASKVAELKLVERRGTIGVVEKTTDSKITLSDINDKNRIIDIDEFTKFLSEDDDNFGISDIKKGMRISVVGLYNKESERLLARFIKEVTIPIFINGVITEKDKENFTIKVLVEDGTSYIIDVENITKNSFFSDGKLESSGFSKIETFQNALIIGYPDPKETNRLTASRIVTFPNLPKNPKIPVLEEPSKSPSPTLKTEKAE